MLFTRLSTLTLLGTLSLSAAAVAGEVSLRYEDFFSRMKVMHKDNYQLTELTFSVPNRAGCRLQEASISTEQNVRPLSFTKAQRLYIPYDEELKQRRALVNLKVDGESDNCGLAVQIRAKTTQTEYKQAMLAQLYREMDEMQAAMKGFPMKYFHSPIQGLRFTLPENTRIILEKDKGYDEFTVSGNWSLSEKQIGSAKSLSFSIAPEVISPWVE